MQNRSRAIYQLYTEACDDTLFHAATALVLLGLVMVYSASIALPDAPKYTAYQPHHFLIRQAAYIALGAVGAAAVLAVPASTWERLSGRIFVASIFMLVVVLVPGIGKSVNGAHRWIHLPGISVQPSEIVKLATILYASGFAVRRHSVLYSLRRGFGPICLALSVVGALLLLEPDMGAFIVVVAIALGILFVAGINVVWFGGLCLLLAVTFATIIATSPWRRARLFAYLDPWEGSHALGKAYQLSHSLIAFGRGELFGVGLGSSIEKLHYLPEAHTDFLLAVIGEELGFLGVAAVVVLFYLVVRRCIMIGRRSAMAGRHFAALAAHGVGIWIGVQACINMAVALGILPTKGLTLPLMSYGGSGLVVNLIAIAMVLRISYENRT
jgi:cell division protein FtsW